MKKLTRRVKNLIFKFSATCPPSKSCKHFFTLDYEDGSYRQKELVRVIKDTVIHFALTPDEISLYKNTDDFGEMDRIAWSRISEAKRDKKGDYGELLLFLILSIFFPTQKFVTKVRLRSSTKEQIKGFDCAHFTVENDNVILWLGEAKFHNNFSNAVNDAVKSIQQHCETDYLKSEISILRPNIEINKGLPVFSMIDDVLNGSITLDKINLRIPILLTYDCSLIKKHKDISTPEFISDMRNEFLNKYKTIESKKVNLKKNIEIMFIVIPFECVADIKLQLELLEEALR